MIRQVWVCYYCEMTNHMRDYSCVSCNGPLTKGRVMNLRVSGEWSEETEQEAFSGDPYFVDSGRFNWELNRTSELDYDIPIRSLPKPRPGWKH